MENIKASQNIAVQRGPCPLLIICTQIKRQILSVSQLSSTGGLLKDSQAPIVFGFGQQQGQLNWIHS